MFDLLLNATRFVLSKDTRDGAHAFFEALTRSPEWKKDICTVEVRVRASDEERIVFVLDVVSRKLQALKFSPDAVTAFRSASLELITNAIEHGCRNRASKRLVVSFEVTQTYAATSATNPRGTRVHLDEWLEKGRLALESTRDSDRGRGLQLAGRHADILQQVGARTIKAVVYRDRVAFEEFDLNGQTVLSVVSGIANPSMPHRLTTHIARRKLRSVVVCLSHREARLIRQERVRLSSLRVVEETKSALAGDDTSRALSAESSASDQDEEEFSNAPTTRVTQIRKSLAEFMTSFRLVIDDDHMIDLLPKDMAFRSLDDAVRSLNA